MGENKYTDLEDDITEEELELFRQLSHIQCIDEGIYPELNFAMDQDIGEIIE